MAFKTLSLLNIRVKKFLVQLTIIEHVLILQRSVLKQDRDPEFGPAVSGLKTHAVLEHCSEVPFCT